MKFQKTFFVIIVVIILLTIATRFVFISGVLRDSDMRYRVTVPVYNGIPDTYYTGKYTESGNCITFKDEFGIERKVCGNYTVSGW